MECWANVLINIKLNGKRINDLTASRDGAFRRKRPQGPWSTQGESHAMGAWDPVDLIQETVSGTFQASYQSLAIELYPTP